MSKQWLTGAAVAAALALANISSGPAQQEPFKGEEWYDQIDVVRVNREDARAFFVPYQDAATALANEASAFTRDFAKSAYYMSLNGTWKFKAVKHPADRIDGFWNPADFSVANWDDIEVPSNWQLARDTDGQPKYDMPIYTNQVYPWDNFGGTLSMINPVKGPTVFNPVGHYRRGFTVPSAWGKRRVFVSFQGVESAFYLWVNGQKVGYAEDSYTQSEFDITKYLRPGENTMAVQVYRWSTGSYLENQDFIRLSGIFRDVFLYSKAEVELRDFFIKPTLSADFKSGSLEVEATVRNFGVASGKYSVEATLKDMDDKNVWKSPLSIPINVTPASNNPTSVTTNASMAVPSPRLWFAETPELYKLLLQLKAPNGQVVETAVVRTGFRKIERAPVHGGNGHQMILFNGKRILLRGTNRHESSVERGRAISKDEIIFDLLTMKRNNINAIRTSHYPNNVITYDLADELGIYICDEANVESHAGATQQSAVDQIPGTNPLWVNSVVDRTTSMVERDKNHPAIIIWSLGNEATYNERPAPPFTNYTMHSSSQYIRKRDRSRLLKYERDNREDIVDIRSTQYPGAASARAMAVATGFPQRRYVSTSPSQEYVSESDLMLPFLMSEYAHSMGNSGGGFADYWKVFREVPQLQGGFIWDFIDQSVWMPVPEGAANIGNGRYFAYGGDWGDAKNDGSFCCNGIMFADRRPKPFVTEIKRCQQEVWAEAKDEDLKLGIVNIRNEFLNKNLKDFAHKWRIKKNGEVVSSGDLSLDIAPLSIKAISIPAARSIRPEPGAEYFLEIDSTLRSDTNWAKAGHSIALSQFKLPIETGEKQLVPDLDKLPQFADAAIVDTQEKTEVKGNGFYYVFDKVKGEFTSIQKNGRELLAKGPRANHWRHPGDNDLQRGPGQFNPTFRVAGRNAPPRQTEARRPGRPSSTVRYMLGSVRVQTGADGKFVGITATSNLSNGATNVTAYTIYSNGDMIVENRLASTLENYMLRIGMNMELTPGFENVEYYGRGPGENYSDRALGSPVGIYKTTINDMFEPYIRPQFFGNRTGVRWIKVTDANGAGIMVIAKDTLEACASNYDDTDFEVEGKPARHLYQVAKRQGAVLNIDMLQAPVGCWGGFTGERAPISMQTRANGTYVYAYKIVLL